MGGVDTPLAQNTFPGQTADVAVSLVAPGVAGSYRGYWEFKNAFGTLFGIGSSASSAWWVDIRVSGTPFATPTPITQPATATPTSAPAATATPTSVSAPTATPTSVAASTWTPTPTGAPVATQTPTFTPTAVPPTATPTAVQVTPTPTLVASGWQLYQNTKYGFAFQIPPGSVVTSKFDNGGHVLLPFTSGTNLVEKYMDVTVAENASSCKSIYSNAMSQASAQTVTINGIQFLQETSTEGAAGNVYDWTGYSTFKGTTCISLSFVLHSNNPGVFPTPPPVYDKAAESAVFSTIMSTFGYQ